MINIELHCNGMIDMIATFKEFLIEEEEAPIEIKTKDFEIPEHNMSFLDAKIEKLNKIAAKLKLSPIVVTKGTPFVKIFVDRRFENPDLPGYDDNGFELKKTKINMIPVHIEGEAPKLNGWSFIGKRQPLEGSSSILAKSAPGNKLPKKYSDDHDLTCDHCKKRARRNETFVVKKGRKYMEVGRSCLKDFLGHADPTKYANFAEALYDIESAFSNMSDPDYEGGYGRVVSLFGVKDIVAAAVHSIKKRGFVSTQSYGSNESTAMAVNKHLNPGRKPASISAKEWFEMNNIPVTKEDEKEAEKVIAWMKNHPKAGKEEFWTNISKAASAENTSLKMTGYLSAGVMMHEKEQGLLVKKEGIMKTLKQEGAGKVGDKININGLVISSFAYQSQGQWGGTKHIVTIKSDDGHLIKMFTSSGDSGVKKDARVNITGKIGSVEPEKYDRSPFKDMIITTMAPRSRIESIPDVKETDAHYHVGDKIKFRRAGKSDGIGIIVAKPVYGKFEVGPVSGKAATIHVNHEDMIQKI